MSRVITFSRTYPSYHPRKEEPTYFIEKLIYSLVAQDAPGYSTGTIKGLRDVGLLKVSSMVKEPVEKHHTIRAGHRFQAGDWFSPRVWGNDINPKSGRSGPYHSKQIVIGTDVQVKKTWDFDAEGTDFFLSGKHELVNPEGFDFSEVEKNDGLGPCELFDWICLSPDFRKTNTFSGQIICWNDKIKY